MYKTLNNLEYIINKAISVKKTDMALLIGKGLVADNSCIVNYNQDFMGFLINNYVIYRTDYIYGVIKQHSVNYSFDSVKKVVNSTFISLLKSANNDILNLFINDLKNRYICINDVSDSPYLYKKEARYKKKMLVVDYVVNNIFDFESMLFASRVLDVLSDKNDYNAIVTVLNNKLIDEHIRVSFYRLNRVKVIGMDSFEVDSHKIMSLYEYDILQEL